MEDDKSGGILDNSRLKRGPNFSFCIRRRFDVLTSEGYAGKNGEMCSQMRNLGLGLEESAAAYVRIVSIGLRIEEEVYLLTCGSGS